MISYDLLLLILPAFFAGVLIAFTHVPLGQEVLKRGIIFIDLAIAQIAAMGIVFAHIVLGAESNHLVAYIIAVIFALVAGIFFMALEYKNVKHQEAFIGVSFIVSACLVVLLFSHDAHGGEEIKNLLAGDILWISSSQLILTAGVYVLAMLAWFGLKRFRKALFYILLPIVVTFSVQIAGVYLVFASLIIPSLGALVYKNENKQLFAAYTISLIAILGGLIASIIGDMPAAPAIVCSYLAVSLCPYIVKRVFN